MKCKPEEDHRLTPGKSNGDRAAKLVNRKPQDPENLLSGFSIFRLKGREGGWAALRDHGRPDPDERITAVRKPQTVVFIALSRLDHENGFFISLQPGQDICVDSCATILHPPTGGGLGIAIWLKL